MATCVPALAQHAYPVTGSSSDLLTTQSVVKKPNGEIVRSGLAASDKSPLGERTPLLLIHGIGASASTQFNWERFLSYAQRDKKFLERYKIYLYHYDSSRSVPAISRNLQQSLHTFIGMVNERPIKILAYSEGGLLTRNALQDAYIDQHTDEVITLATPFHGSPLANPEWINQQVRTESPFSLVRIGQKIAYRITGRLYPTFREDFHWDNFDGAIPADQYNRNKVGLTQTEYALARKKRFVTYGSYFGLEVDPATMPKALDVQAALPKEKLIFANLFRRNFLFSLVRNNIARLPLAIRPNNLDAKGAVKTTVSAQKMAEQSKAVLEQAVHEPDSTVQSANVMLALASADSPMADKPDSVVPLDLKDTPKAEVTLTQANALMALGDVAKLTQPAVNLKPMQPVSMMMFNDGISPISSTLWLGRYIPAEKGASVSVDKLWDTLKKLKGNDNTRLFAGVDHRNWMDGTTRTGEAKIQDLLNPDEPPRTIFAWILYDLMS